MAEAVKDYQKLAQDIIRLKRKRKPVKPPASDDIRSICTCLLCPCSRRTFTGIADHSYNGSTIRDRNRSLSGF